jgi:hypothetical protein
MGVIWGINQLNRDIEGNKGMEQGCGKYQSSVHPETVVTGVTEHAIGE